MKVVVGLGNPGAKYRQTRHNVGFDVLAELANRHGGTTPTIKHESEIVEIFLANEKVILAAPQTFMNLSGRAVRSLMDFYRLSLEDMIVICDDLNLERGRLRLKPSGSAGGQKGLANIIQLLKTEEFARLRVGIGRPPGRMDAAAFVLGKFTEAESPEIQLAVAKAADGVETWIQEDFQTSMNRVNAPN
ncbi:aminoacyl-tRNA hydrolase [Thalassoroseus pseudoceratinae]|uniref:aminoacyl-tRNA hydrolase n=1 Tax=Thalassoroseus pseudoceratinae TaxID=2713176 RepID=UPI00142228AC|nr:aminoacyl-tRNA hydrolase [Thalassoroseus pseudoceratinae]